MLCLFQFWIVHVDELWFLYIFEHKYRIHAIEFFEENNFKLKYTTFSICVWLIFNLCINLTSIFCDWLRIRMNCYCIFYSIYLKRITVMNRKRIIWNINVLLSLNWTKFLLPESKNWSNRLIFLHFFCFWNW